jgi:hypothetical protein
MVEAGVDLDQNGALDPVEVSATSYVCNGPTGPAVLKYRATQNVNVAIAGETWVAVPGASVQFELTETRFVEMRAHGSVTGSGGTTTFTHCGFRFVVDGVAYGNNAWGDQTVLCNKTNTAPGWWTPWYIERELSLDVGIHEVSVELIGWSSSTVQCRMTAEPYSATKLVVEVR